MTKVAVLITRRPEIADPQGKTVLGALHNLGFGEVIKVRVDRTIYLEIDGEPAEVEAKVKLMCEELLANPVLEDYQILIEP